MKNLNQAIVVVEETTLMSQLKQGGGGGTDFRNRSDVKDDRSNLSQVADKCESLIIKTKLIILCTMTSLIFYDPASCRKICNGS